MPNPSRTNLGEPELTQLRQQGYEAARKSGPFVDPHVIARCLHVLDRRGEPWAAAILGRDIARRSKWRPDRPWLRTGEEYILVAADVAEDDRVLDDVDEWGQQGSSE